MIDKLKNLDKKKIIAGIIVILVLVALPITVLSLRNRQNIASQAGNPVTLALSPTTKSFAVGESTDVQVVLKAGTISVQTVEFSLSYGTPNATNAANAEFIPNANSGFSSLYTPAVDNNNSAKTLTYKTAVSIQATPITGDITLGTLRLTGINPGTAQISFTGGIFNELSGELTPTFTNGSYTVGAPATATITQGNTLPTGYKTPAVVTSLISSPPRTFKSAVYAYGHTVSVIYRWGTTAGSTCQNLPNTVNGPVSITGGDSPISPNATPAGVTFPNNSIIYYCASIIYGNNQAKYGQVAQFNNGNVGGNPSNPPATSTLTPVTTNIPATATSVPATATSVPATATSIPATNSPIPSPNSNQSAINIALKLPGIGNNANGTRNLGENNSPRSKRTFDVYLFDTSGNQTGGTFPTELTYSPSEGAYKGTVTFNNVPLNSVYTIKVKADNSVLKNIGFVQLLPGGTVSLNANNPSGELVVGKVNTTSPNVIGLQDYNDFMKCLRNQSSCTTAMRTKADFTDDGKVDLKDLNIIISSFANRQGD